jgi:hypothetical protein
MPEKDEGRPGEVHQKCDVKDWTNRRGAGNFLLLFFQAMSL